MNLGKTQVMIHQREEQNITTAQGKTLQIYFELQNTYTLAK